MVGNIVTAVASVSLPARIILGAILGLLAGVLFGARRRGRSAPLTGRMFEIVVFPYLRRSGPYSRPRHGRQRIRAAKEVENTVCLMCAALHVDRADVRHA
jgi:hypothetical protein